MNKHLNGTSADDAVTARRIVARIYDRLGGDALKAFVQTRAPELALELVSSDEALQARLGASDAPLLIWSQKAGEADPIGDVNAAFGSGRRTPVILMVERYDAALVSRAMAHGIAGLITRQMSADMVLCVVRLVLAGGTYFPCEPTWFAPALTVAPDQAASPVTLRRGAYGLTPRQLDVLGYICQGMSNKIIARALGMRETTVKAHVMQIMRRLNAENRTQVALRVAQSGFMAPPSAEAAKG